jgi:hypothetical protein
MMDAGFPRWTAKLILCIRYQVDFGSSVDAQIFLPIVLMNDNASIPHDPEVSIATDVDSR